MSYKVAIVTSDNVTIGNHFAPTEPFAIYRVHDDFSYVYEETRPSPLDGSGAPDGVYETAGGCGCGDGSATTAAGSNQCGASLATAGAPAGIVGYALAGGGCGSGCGGCGGNGGSGGPVDPRLERTVAALADVQLVIAGTLSPEAQSAFSRRAIRAFAVGGGVTKALDKLVAFEKRQHERFAAHGGHISAE